MADRLIMLFSTDWFFQYWHVVGLEMEESQKNCFQRGCRDIVTQFVSNAKEYWHVSFAAGRREKTRAMLAELGKQCRLNQAVVTHIERLLATGQQMSSQERTPRWAWFALTERLLTAASVQEDAQLDHAIRDILTRVYTKHDVTRLDFENISQTSESQWDTYIRGLTPNQPTYIVDYLLTELIPFRAFDTVWADLRKELTEDQINELLDWYRTTAASFLGVNISSLDLS